MTMGFWRCKCCDFGCFAHLSEFVPVCLNCKTEYVLLGEAHGFHIAHEIPITLPVGSTDFKSVSMVNQFFSLGGQEKREIICFEKEFYDYLRSCRKSGGLNVLYKPMSPEQKERVYRLNREWLFKRKDRVMQEWERIKKRLEEERKKMEWERVQKRRNKLEKKKELERRL